jgi:hypothetical protein
MPSCTACSSAGLTALADLITGTGVTRQRACVATAAAPSADTCAASVGKVLPEAFRSAQHSDSVISVQLAYSREALHEGTSAAQQAQYVQPELSPSSVAAGCECLMVANDDQA